MKFCYFVLLTKSKISDSTFNKVTLIVFNEIAILSKCFVCSFVEFKIESSTSSTALFIRRRRGGGGVSSNPWEREPLATGTILVSKIDCGPDCIYQYFFCYLSFLKYKNIYIYQWKG